MKIQAKTKDLHSKNWNVSAVKQAKGITLIALVITIIVLLILAGVTIAILTGENGILNRATEMKGTSSYASACEQVRLVYMTVKTEIMTQKVKNSSYNAQTNGAILATLVGNELKGTEWSTPTYSSTSKAIEITYTNSSLRAGMVAENKPKESGKIEFKIGLLEQDATLSIDDVEVAGGSSSPSDNTGGVGPVNPAQVADVDTAYIQHFGKTVSWSGIASSEEGKWRLFYVDTSGNAYLIRDRLEQTKKLNSLSSWSTATVTDITRGLNPGYTAWTLGDNGDGNINANLQAVAALTDETASEWAGYKTAIPGATMVVGGPSFELFVKSYNATHNNSTYEKEICYEIDNICGYGYNSWMMIQRSS